MKERGQDMVALLLLAILPGQSVKVFDDRVQEKIILESSVRQKQMELIEGTIQMLPGKFEKVECFSSRDIVNDTNVIVMSSSQEHSGCRIPVAEESLWFRFGMQSHMHSKEKFNMRGIEIGVDIDPTKFKFSRIFRFLK